MADRGGYLESERLEAPAAVLCKVVGMTLASNYFIPLYAWSGDFYCWHSDDEDRIQRMKDSAFAHVVQVSTNIRNEEWITEVSKFVKDKWTFCTMHTANGYVHTVGTVHPSDAALIKMFCEK